MNLITEADTCRKYVLPKLYAAGRDDDRISEQKTFTDDRIVVAGNRTTRRPQKRADYLLRYRPDFFGPEKPDAINPCCWLCRPEGARGFTTSRVPVLPRNSNDPLSDGKLRANDFQPGSCPRCGSRIRAISPRKRSICICADCGLYFSAPRKRRASENGE